LGRYHAVRGEVGSGARRGRNWAIPPPTFLNLWKVLMPADGVYATIVTHRGIRYPAATSVGVNPTFGELTESVVESHLLDEKIDLYGETIRVEFVEFIRGMRAFPSADHLAAQMSADEKVIRGIVKDVPGG